MRKLFILTIVVILACFQARAASEQKVLKTSEATLTIDKEGNLKIIHGNDIVVNCPLHTLWKVVLKNRLNNKEFVITPDGKERLDTGGDTIRIIARDIIAGGKRLPVEARFNVFVKDDAFCFSGFLGSKSDEWIFKEYEYPLIEGIKLSGGNQGVYWPVGLGEYYPDPVKFGNKRYAYPCVYGSMPWFSVNTPDAGLYYGCHDPGLGMKEFFLFYDKESSAFESGVKVPVYSVEYSLPDVMIKPYRGKWYMGAEFYRRWFDKNFKLDTPPSWVKNDAGWFLAILKQQNGDVMWPYKEIDRLCDIAGQLNLKTIGLYGWAHGGHDRYYPNYVPDNLLGGREELKKAIERAHHRGMKIILYANGKVADVSTEFFRNLGNETMIFDEKLNPVLDVWRKHTNATPVVFAQQCTGSSIWRKTMADLALQAVALGADGIIYDQLGGTPHLCFSLYHDHSLPQECSGYRVKMIHEIQNKMKEINPDFILMAEGQTDATLNDIDYFHGCSSGYSIRPYGFPALFRYTFPELVAIQRNPNPMISREEANFASVNGLRHEIESRYPADVRYLLKGILPGNDDYLNIHTPPDITRVRQVPAREAAAYVHSLLEFENENSDFFRYGKFIALNGIRLEGTDITANGFVNGNRIGVVVWNINLTEKRNFSLSVPGYKPVKAAEPGKDVGDAMSPLDANSLRLLVFEKEVK